MWQEEGLLLTSRGPSKELKRRRSDKEDPADSLRCPQCGHFDERHEREWRDLSERLAELETENTLLRASAIAFGELAQRLNLRVRTDRRSGFDRRQQSRTTSDRRTANS